MARIVKQHKGYKIKATSKRDHTDYRYWVCLPEDHQFVDWECDTLQEAIDFIDSKFQDAAKQKKMNIGAALKEYAAIVKATREEYAEDELTVSILRKEHPELDFMDDDELEEIISFANKGRETQEPRYDLEKMQAEGWTGACDWRLLQAVRVANAAKNEDVRIEEDEWGKTLEVKDKDFGTWKKVAQLPRRTSYILARKEEIQK